MHKTRFSGPYRPTRLLPALVVLTLITGPTPSTASGWVWQNPLPQGNTLNGVHFSDASTGLAVGSGGTVIRTTDGGITWFVLSSGTELTLYGIHMTDALSALAVGEEGTVLQTVDGGIIWSPRSSGTTGHLKSVCMTTGGAGVIVGWGTYQTEDKILRTSDGGANWTAVPCGATSGLEDVVFVDESTAVAVGWNETIVRSVDGGSSWQVVTEDPAGRFRQLWAVAFTDEYLGLAAGRNGLMMRTSDGGVSWSLQPSVTTNWLRGVAFFDADIAVAAGNDFFRSIDSGYTWSLVTNPAGVPLEGVTVIDDGIGVAVGTEGAILRSDDFGTSWTERRFGYANGYLTGVEFANPSTGFAVAYSNDPANGVASFLRTADGGATWTVQPAGATRLADLSFPDALNGVAVGDDGVVYRTTDGGDNWSLQNSGVSDRLAGISMPTASEGTAVGWNGTILRTADGGTSWIAQNSGTSEPLWDVCFMDEDHGVVVGDYTILRTTDGGATWQEVPHDMSRVWFYGVAFADSDHGMAVGDFSTIARTADGGATWTAQLSTNDDAEILQSVALADPLNAIAVGLVSRGRVNCLRTIDGGATWVPEPTGSAGSLLDVYYSGATATVVGTGGAILRWENPSVPVALQEFDSCWKQGRVEIRWRLIDASGELSFDIARARGSLGAFVGIPDVGVYRRGEDFVFEDHAAEPGETYRYRVVIREDGDRVASFETQVSAVAAALSLRQNHPNPFNPSTHIPFVIDKAQHVSLSIYDISGRLIRTLVDRKMSPGSYSEEWDGIDADGGRVATGVYFYRLTAGKNTLSRKALLLK